MLASMNSSMLRIRKSMGRVDEQPLSSSLSKWRWNVLNECHYVLVIRKLYEGVITVDYKWVYKNKCGSIENFKIRFMESD
jgi:hypothetical protein